MFVALLYITLGRERSPVLYTVGVHTSHILEHEFSTVWAVCAAQGGNEGISEQLLRVFFQLFVGKKKFKEL